MASEPQSSAFLPKRSLVHASLQAENAVRNAERKAAEKAAPAN
jgi:hypothetical protein